MKRMVFLLSLGLSACMGHSGYYSDCDVKVLPPGERVVSILNRETVTIQDPERTPRQFMIMSVSSEFCIKVVEK